MIRRTSMGYEIVAMIPMHLLDRHGEAEQGKAAQERGEADRAGRIVSLDAHRIRP